MKVNKLIELLRNFRSFGVRPGTFIERVQAVSQITGHGNQSQAWSNCDKHNTHGEKFDINGEYKFNASGQRIPDGIVNVKWKPKIGFFWNQSILLSLNYVSVDLPHRQW